MITSDAEAIEVARTLAARFAEGAAERDREGLLPIEEIDAYSQSGLWAINVPKRYGGAGVSYATLAEVIRTIAAADPSIAQITQNHLATNPHIDADASEEQKRFLFGLVLQGIRFGNAFSEKNSKTVAAFDTRFVEDGDDVVINGEKFYTTGALLAHVVQVVAVDDAGNGHLIFVDRDTPGLTVINDWSSFGQRTTASGSVKLVNVRVPKARVVPTWKAFDGRLPPARSRRSSRRRSISASHRARSTTPSPSSEPSPGPGSTAARSAPRTIPSPSPPSATS